MVGLGVFVVGLRGYVVVLRASGVGLGAPQSVSGSPGLQGQSWEFLLKFILTNFLDKNFFFDKNFFYKFLYPNFNKRVLKKNYGPRWNGVVY